MITWREGDLFASGLPAIAHGVNCKGVMGAGIAVEFRRRWPDMYESYRRRCLQHSGMIPGDVMPWKHPGGGPVVFNLATQADPGPCAQPWMITAAVGRMITEAYHDFRITGIGLPVIGCGIGGLTPDDLRAALAPYADAPVNLTIFKYVPGAGLCDGFAGIGCPGQAAWLRTYECPAGHLSYRRSCEGHDQNVTLLSAATRVCDHPLGAAGVCVRWGSLVSRRETGRGRAAGD